MHFKLEPADLMSVVLKIYISVIIRKVHRFLVKKRGGGGGTCFCVIKIRNIIVTIAH